MNVNSGVLQTKYGIPLLSIKPWVQVWEYDKYSLARFIKIDEAYLSFTWLSIFIRIASY
jgi:hypothetical protein